MLTLSHPVHFARRLQLLDIGAGPELCTAAAPAEGPRLAFRGSFVAHEPFEHERHRLARKDDAHLVGGATAVEVPPLQHAANGALHALQQWHLMPLGSA